jgi:hypothetical protein
MTDSEEVFDCITPALTAFMFWEPPQSLAAYKARREATLRSKDKNDFSFVIRRLDTIIYATAIQNVPSRRIAESLGGEIIGTRTSPKYDSVVYKIRWT